MEIAHAPRTIRRHSWASSLACLLPLWLLSVAILAEGFPAPPVPLGLALAAIACALGIAALLLSKRAMPIPVLLYSLIPLWLMVTFDEIATHYKTPFIILCALVLSAAALGSLRSRSRWARWGWLAAGALITVGTAALLGKAYWDMIAVGGYSACYPDCLPPANTSPSGPGGFVPAQVTPAIAVNPEGKTPVEPLLHGMPYGLGSWSPQGDYLFIPLLEMPTAGSDQRLTSLHFISTVTGEDCPASETFLGHQGSQQNYAWLDNQRALFIDRLGRPLLFMPCQQGFQDLSDRFDEPLLRVAQPFHNTELAAEGALLLEAPSAYWLLDPATLQAHRLADPVPTSDVTQAYLQERLQKEPIPTLDLRDSFAWLPSGRQISIMQPIAGETERSRLVVLDRDGGQVLRSLELETGNEGTAPLVEWMGPERPFVWGFGAGGPLLVDLSADPPHQVHVFPELFGLDLVYPDQVHSMGAFYSPADGSFHIVVHTNLPDDQSIYIFHGEIGQLEKLAGDRQVMLILPGDQRMPLAVLQDTPTYDDGFYLVWVDAPGKTETHLQVAGHTPRNYSILQSRLLPKAQRILFGSTQGVSLVDLSGGETQAFWRLVEADDSSLPALNLSPDGHTLIAIAHLIPAPGGKEQGSRLYWIDLPGQ